MQKQTNGDPTGAELPPFRKSAVSRETIRKSRKSLGFLDYFRLFAADSGLGNGKKCGPALASMEPNQATTILREWQARGWKNKVSNALRDIEDAGRTADILGHWAVISQSEAKEAIASSGLFLIDRKITSMSLDEFVEKLCWATVHTEKIGKLLGNLTMSDGGSSGKELSRETLEMGHRMQGVPERDAHWVDVSVECPVKWRTTYEWIRESNWEARERAHKAILEEPESLSILLIVERLENGRICGEGIGRCIRVLEELSARVDGDLRESALAGIETAKKKNYDLDLEAKPREPDGTTSSIEIADSYWA